MRKIENIPGTSNLISFLKHKDLCWLQVSHSCFNFKQKNIWVTINLLDFTSLDQFIYDHNDESEGQACSIHSWVNIPQGQGEGQAVTPNHNITGKEHTLKQQPENQSNISLNTQHNICMNKQIQIRKFHTFQYKVNQIRIRVYTSK